MTFFSVQFAVDWGLNRYSILILMFGILLGYLVDSGKINIYNLFIIIIWISFLFFKDYRKEES